LQVVETSSSGCTASSVISITTSNTPNPSITPTTGNVCQGDVIAYSTTYNTGNTYLWAVTNGTCSGCGAYSAVASISVTWGSSGNGSITVIEKNSSGITGTDTKSYTISPMPETRTLSAAAICSGNSGSVLIPTSEQNVSYQLHLSSGTAVDVPYDGTGSNISIPVGPLAITTSYYVTASNEGCALRIPASPGYVTLTVNANPTVTITGVIRLCEGESTSLEAGTGFNSYQWGFGSVNLGTLHNQTITTATNNSATPVTETYAVTVTDTNGCPASDTHDISVYHEADTGPAYYVPNDHNE
jgi:hypothetical protein